MMYADAFYEQAEEAYELRDLYIHEPTYGKQAGVLDYFEFFCAHMDIHPGPLVTPERKQEYVKLRCQFSAFVRQESHKSISLREIGEMLGGRDHSSIIHAIDQHGEWMIISQTYRQHYNGLIKRWRHQHGE